MGEENFPSDEDEDHPAQDSCLTLQAISVIIANDDSKQRKNKGNDAYKGDGENDVGFQEGKGDPNRQGVDAGSDWE